MSCTPADLLFAAAAGAFVALAIAGSYWTVSLLTLLRLRHPPTYDVLGRPDPIAQADSAANSAAVLRFIFLREYVELGDPEVSRLCDFLRWCTFSSIVLLALIATALVAAPSVEVVWSFSCWRPM